MIEQEIRSGVIKECSTWLGTPFRHQAGVKGAGCDCAHIVSCVFETLGLIQHVEYPPYGADWFRHAEKEDKYIIETMLKVGFREISEDEAKAGDVAVTKFGRAYSHCVILNGDGRGFEAWPTHNEVALVRLKHERLWANHAKRFFTVFK